MIKTFKLFERLYERETFYKLVNKEDWNKIRKTGAILPFGKVPIGDKIYKGSWAIPKSNMDAWLTKIKFFGSPLQALLMKRAAIEQTVVLLEFNINGDNIVRNRDITKMFVNFSFRGYRKSFTETEIYPITESFVSGIITDFRKISEFKVPIELSEYMAEPESVKDLVLGLSNDVKYTNKKMTSIKSAFFQVLLKKIFTFDFKNF